MDGSEDSKLSIRKLPGMVVGNRRLDNGQIYEQQVEDPIEIHEVPEDSNSGYKTSDAVYVLKENDQIEIEVKDDELYSKRIDT